jgi:hypothetical protein
MYSEGYAACDIALCHDATEEEIRKVLISTFSVDYYNKAEKQRQKRA